MKLYKEPDYNKGLQITHQYKLVICSCTYILLIAMTSDNLQSYELFQRYGFIFSIMLFYYTFKDPSGMDMASCISVLYNKNDTIYFI